MATTKVKDSRDHLLRRLICSVEDNGASSAAVALWFGRRVCLRLHGHGGTANWGWGAEDAARDETPLGTNQVTTSVHDE